MFRDAGWRKAIVSNHCPGLESLVGPEPPLRVPHAEKTEHSRTVAE